MAFGTIVDSEAFDFSNIQANRDQSIVVAAVVPIQDVQEASLVVRVEDLVISSATSIEINVYGTWPNDKENVRYRTPGAVAQIVMDNATGPQSILLASFDWGTGQPPALCVEVRGVQHVTTAAALWAKVSVGLQMNSSR